MSVILEFTVSADEFTLGKVLSGSPEMRLELERIVPMGETVMPFFWATGADFNEFEAIVRDSPHVTELRALDRVNDSSLYRLDWKSSDKSGLIEGVSQTNATVLEAYGDETWLFRLRFLNHEVLSQFYNYCTAHDISLHIERTYTLQEETAHGHQFDLSQKQREALVLALRRGYFATPREISLTEVADELNLSRQALSDRIRRGNEKILHTALLSSAADFD